MVEGLRQHPRESGIPGRLDYDGRVEVSRGKERSVSRTESLLLP